MFVMLLMMTFETLMFLVMLFMMMLEMLLYVCDAYDDVYTDVMRCYNVSVMMCCNV